MSPKAHHGELHACVVISRAIKPTTGHTWMAPLRACPTISPGTPLFCTVNVIPDQSTARNREAFASNTSNWSCPI